MCNWSQSSVKRNITLFTVKLIVSRRGREVNLHTLFLVSFMWSDDYVRRPFIRTLELIGQVTVQGPFCANTRTDKDVLYRESLWKELRKKDHSVRTLLRVRWYVTVNLGSKHTRSQAKTGVASQPSAATTASFTSTYFRFFVKIWSAFFFFNQALISSLVIV